MKNNYFRCRKRADSKGCEGCGTLRVGEVEESIYSQMARKLHEFQVLTGSNATKRNPKLMKLNLELAQTEAEIEKLLNTLTGANAVLISYANGKIEELDAKRQSLLTAIATITAEVVSPEQIKRISGYLNDWENIDFDSRRIVVDGLINKILATSDGAKIEWKI
ncbi:MAG: phage protease [Oscillospiraceae bacterium]|nr:phage protease [Oscillospiraceae bacterium]